MEPNAFAGRAADPSPSELAAALGPALPLWEQTLASLRPLVDAVEWYSYSPKFGWSLRLRRGDRTVVYLVPSPLSFRAAFTLGEKAVEAARGAGLPRATLTAIEGARRYVEGRSVAIEVTKPGDIDVVLKLAHLKLSAGARKRAAP